MQYFQLWRTMITCQWFANQSVQVTSNHYCSQDDMSSVGAATKSNMLSVAGARAVKVIARLFESPSYAIK
jgi:hypothetical protein